MNLKPKPTPCHPSVVSLTSAMGAARAWRQQRGVHFHPQSFGRFPNILTTAHFHARPTHCLLSLSSLCGSFSQTHLCLCLSLSHSYDLGVRVVPTPSQPWIKLPCHYSVVPPARVLYVRHSGACLPARCLPLRTWGLAQFNHRRPWSVESLQLWHRLPGKLCRQASGGGAGLAVVSELYFQFHVGWRKFQHLGCF